jgi:hypothetical protein
MDETPQDSSLTASVLLYVGQEVVAKPDLNRD